VEGTILAVGWEDRVAVVTTVWKAALEAVVDSETSGTTITRLIIIWGTENNLIPNPSPLRAF
jgi:hypothetical protein